MTSNFTASKRTQQFARNEALEGLLRQLNSSLWTAEQEELKKYSEPKRPLLLLVGPLRSGTTLFMQWLANSGLVAYPTNLLSRFYSAPVIGAMIQKLLTDKQFSYRDELNNLVNQIDYKSDNGKTSGALSPNEFWYFWRRFLPPADKDCFTDAELEKQLDNETLLSELDGITSVFNKPFAAKALIFNYNIEFISRMIPTAIFIRLFRDPVENVLSILEARKRQFGSENVWYSFKIPEYEFLKDLDPLHQAAGQVYFNNRAISKGIDKLPEERRLIVDYTDFCRNPEMFYTALLNLLKLTDGGADLNYDGEPSFQVSVSSSNNEQREIIDRAFSDFEKGLM